METRRHLQVLAFLLFSIGLSVSGQTDKKTYYVFAGEVNSVNLTKEGRVLPTITVDTGALKGLTIIQVEKDCFSVCCTIEKSFYGNYQGDTIRFTMYDEFSIPDLTFYHHALCVLEKQENGQFKLSPFQNYDLYQTIEGNWIIPYPNALSWGSDFFQTNKRKVVLKDTEYIDMEYIKTKSIWHSDIFSSNYKVVGEKAIPTYGASVDAFVTYLLSEKIKIR